ncbi:MAG: hypothetical protein P8Z30_20190 [Acidobacteriota bacterium]
MRKPSVGRREFMKAAGVSAAALKTTGGLGAETNVKKHSDVPLAPATQFPKLAFITDYPPQKLAFGTPFWDAPPSNNAPEFPQARKDGFILAYRFLRQYLPGRLS